jgi:hypothetical protein
MGNDPKPDGSDRYGEGTSFLAFTGHILLFNPYRFLPRLNVKHLFLRPFGRNRSYYQEHDAGKSAATIVPQH